jgi:hypothetical protein
MIESKNWKIIIKDGRSISLESTLPPDGGNEKPN